jgi:hypothetical protein
VPSYVVSKICHASRAISQFEILANSDGERVWHRAWTIKVLTLIIIEKHHNYISNIIMRMYTCIFQTRHIIGFYSYITFVKFYFIKSSHTFMYKLSKLITQYICIYLFTRRYSCNLKFFVLFLVLIICFQIFRILRAICFDTIL